MSKCGYYDVIKGKPTCKHPNYADRYNPIRRTLQNQCDICRWKCGGIWPSQVPKANQDEWKQDVIDKNGSVILNE